MKNQYFGDQRDFFKYDLLMELLERPLDVDRLTFIPMLTANDSGSHGQKTNYGRDGRRGDLYHFLRYCLARGGRDIQQLRHYFGGRSFEYEPYKDSEHFLHAERAKYFQNIPNRALTNALIFVDPDRGLEPKRLKQDEEDKYLLYSELGGVLNRANTSSVSVVFQFLPTGDRRAGSRKKYFAEKHQRLSAETQVPHAFHIADGEIAFFGIAKTSTTGNAIREAFKKYAYRHTLEFGP